MQSGKIVTATGAPVVNSRSESMVSLVLAALLGRRGRFSNDPYDRRTCVVRLYEPADHSYIVEIACASAAAHHAIAAIMGRRGT